MRLPALPLAAVLLATQVHGAFGQSAAPRAPLTERERAIHLLNRATYGARPEDVEEVLRMGRAAWIERQLEPEALEHRLVEAGPVTAIVDGPSGTATRLVVLNGGGTMVNSPLANKLVRAIDSERQLEQVMTDFWFNHFSVTDEDGPSRVLVSYEDTIRAQVFGRFRDLLGATARHPAMLIYLDNHLSGAPPPGSPPGARSINESYARALLELHTLGVDGGYTQADVTAVARAFTGWSVQLEALRQPSGADDYRLTGDPHFVYRPAWHDTAAKVVLGLRLRVRDGDEVLDMLARHPATARHIATKLVRQFVADDPPTVLVDDLTRVFLVTDGDLAAVTRALFASERFYAPSHYRAKVRRPFEYVVGALRLTDATRGPAAATVLSSHLRAMQHEPYQAPSPAGYPTSAGYWVGTGPMIDRLDLAVEISNNVVAHAGDLVPSPPDISITRITPSVGIDPWSTAGVSRDVFTELGAAELARRALAGLLSRLVQGAPTDRLDIEIARQLAGLSGPDDADAALRRAIALVLSSPEFQRY